MKYIILNRACDARSMKSVTGFPASPINDNAQPNMTEISSTCRTSPLVKAPTNVVGMSFIRNSAVPELFTCEAVSTYALSDAASSDLGSIFMPAPGWKAYASAMPSISAIVVMTSK